MKKLLLLAIILITVQKSQAQVIEDFETWNPYSVLFTQLTEPDGWSGSDSFFVGYGKLFSPLGTFQQQIFQENPGQAGTGALRVESKFQDTINAGIATLNGKDYPGICTNSLIAIDFINNTYTQSGGAALTIRPSSTSMYVKNNLVGGDSTYITALLLDDSDGADSIIALADTVLTTNIANYTQITFPFVYNGSNLVPTLVRYTISSGNPLALLDSTNTFSVHDGTSITVDNINVNTNTGVRQLINSSPIAKVYPTVVNETLHIDLFNEKKGSSLSIFQINGQLVGKYELKEKNNVISLSDLSSGSYIYHIQAENVIYQTGKLVR